MATVSEDFPFPCDRILQRAREELARGLSQGDDLSVRVASALAWLATTTVVDLLVGWSVDRMPRGVVLKEPMRVASLKGFGAVQLVEPFVALQGLYVRGFIGGGGAAVAEQLLRRAEVFVNAARAVRPKAAQVDEMPIEGPRIARD